MGIQSSFENMRKVLDVFAYSRELVNDELAQVRYEGSIQPGFQESFSSMFPAPRQRWVKRCAVRRTFGNCRTGHSSFMVARTR